MVQPSTQVARVIEAGAKGGRSQNMAPDVEEDLPLKGAFHRTARVMNTMVGRHNAFTSEVMRVVRGVVDQSSSLAGEVTRVAREVGTQGRLGGDAVVKAVADARKDLTDNVNSMAGTPTNHVPNIAGVAAAVVGGDLSTKIRVDARGEIVKLKNTINTIVDQLKPFAPQVTRVPHEVGSEGKLGERAGVKEVADVWKDFTDNVNSMGGNLTNQMCNSRAQIKGVAGTWEDLTESVNSMANDLTSQARNIAEVTSAVTKGDFSTRISIGVQGEILELKNTMNTKVDQLNGFACEVTRVACAVGTEGIPGGEVRDHGVAGLWKNLTDNVKFLAASGYIAKPVDLDQLFSLLRLSLHGRRAKTVRAWAAV